MITIHNLEVRFEVEGSGDKAAFSRLFERHARSDRERQDDRASERRELDRERALGDGTEETK